MSGDSSKWQRRFFIQWGSAAIGAVALGTAIKETVKHYQRVTPGFADLEKSHPELARLRRSVGEVIAPHADNKTATQASAVLLDGEGTLVFSHHQIRIARGDAFVTFFPEHFTSARSNVELQFAAQHVDLAFGSIDQDLIKKYGLARKTAKRVTIGVTSRNGARANNSSSMMKSAIAVTRGRNHKSSSSSSAPR
jgi:hypothetical protein